MEYLNQFLLGNFVKVTMQALVCLSNYVHPGKSHTGVREGVEGKKNEREKPASNWQSRDIVPLLCCRFLSDSKIINLIQILPRQWCLVW